MATHSSVLAWKISGMGEPGGLSSMGSHRVGHDWSNSATAALSITVTGGKVAFTFLVPILWIRAEISRDFFWHLERYTFVSNIIHLFKELWYLTCVPLDFPPQYPDIYSITYLFIYYFFLCSFTQMFSFQQKHTKHLLSGSFLPSRASHSARFLIEAGRHTWGLTQVLSEVE